MDLRVWIDKELSKIRPERVTQEGFSGQAISKSLKESDCIEVSIQKGNLIGIGYGSTKKEAMVMAILDFYRLDRNLKQIKDDFTCECSPT